jgi:hypothetical protein
MDDLFTLYRYLARNQHGEEDNPYVVALHTLEPVLDLLAELESTGSFIRDQGGIEWLRASAITEKIIESYKSGLCLHADSSLEAVKDFASTHISLDEIDKLIDALHEQKLTLQAFKKLEDEELGDLAEHPF